MATKAQMIDRAMDILEAKKADIRDKATMECAALERAIQTLQAQRRKARVSRPRPVAPAAGTCHGVNAKGRC